MRPADLGPVATAAAALTAVAAAFALGLASGWLTLSAALLILGIWLAVFLVLFLLGACRVAGDADEAMERDARERRR